MLGIAFWVTTTALSPAVANSGAVQVIVSAVGVDGSVHASPPTVTVAVTPAAKVPVMVIRPPPRGRDGGATLATMGYVAAREKPECMHE